VSEEGRGFPPVPLVLDTSVIIAIARSDAQITSLILSYDDAGQPMVIPVLTMTAAAIDMHTDSTGLVLRGLQKQAKVMVAPLQGADQAAALAGIIAKTGLDHADAQVAAVALAGTYPILTLDAAKWQQCMADLDEHLHIVEIADPEDGTPSLRTGPARYHEPGTAAERVMAAPGSRTPANAADNRDSRTARSRVEAVEEAVEHVGDIGVIERDGVRVIEAGLGLEQAPAVHQVGGHAVAEAVQRRELAALGPAVRCQAEPAGRAGPCIPASGFSLSRPSPAAQDTALRMRSQRADTRATDTPSCASGRSRRASPRASGIGTGRRTAGLRPGARRHGGARPAWPASTAGRCPDSPPAPQP
jgi:predicted nucleic acid-binding protein